MIFMSQEVIAMDGDTVEVRVHDGLVVVSPRGREFVHRLLFTMEPMAARKLAAAIMDASNSAIDDGRLP
jgi:antitoxin component of MazEF toxin-antitoxin module